MFALITLLVPLISLVNSQNDTESRLASALGNNDASNGVGSKCGDTQRMVDECFKDLPPHLMEFLQSTKIAINERDISSKCTVFNRGMRCFDDYTSRCLTNKTLNLFKNNVEGARRFFQRFCSDREFQKALATPMKTVFTTALATNATRTQLSLHVTQPKHCRMRSTSPTVANTRTRSAVSVIRDRCTVVAPAPYSAGHSCCWSGCLLGCWQVRPEVVAMRKYIYISITGRCFAFLMCVHKYVCVYVSGNLQWKFICTYVLYVQILCEATTVVFPSEYIRT
ncbi:uncharacterized protein LOC101462094 isoform X1 [Ceratitis capitata]|nr:uncharacterized protein LOC101462094 isoform X1 [Ceratitis capitata]